MIDIKLLESLDDSVKKEIVDYHVGMPDVVKFWVKNNLDKILANSINGTIKIGQYGTLFKYIPKSYSVEITRDGMPDIQNQYDLTKKKIIESPELTYKNQVFLSKILDAECSDSSQLLQLEVTIGDYLSHMDMRDIREIQYMCYILLFYIMPYKYKVIDLCIYIQNSDLLDYDECNHFQNINRLIRTVLKNTNTLPNEYDLAVILYYYFNDLGIENNVFKYNLTSRFDYFIRPLSSDHFIEAYHSYLNNFILNKLVPTELVGNLIDAKLKDNVFYNPAENFDNATMRTVNSIIFNFPCIMSISDELLAQIAVEINNLPLEEIAKYIDTNIRYLDFGLNANDIGHLKHLDENDVFGTAYSKTTQELIYILIHEGIPYVLCKDFRDSKQIYGISLLPPVKNEEGTPCRNCLKVKESTKYTYQYIY